MELDRPRFAFRAEVVSIRPRLAPGIRFEGLWSVGELSPLAGLTVAVVGSRAPSDGARERAGLLGRELARAGVCVVSGLALGIDAAAHEGAISGGGPTIGILGGGHRQFFPRRNRPLAEAICARGGAVLSPYAPDEPARPYQFLQRNGVVAALADAVVIVEAAARSGALNTATWASDLGIHVFAYPGDVDRPKAAGCNALIRDGANLARDAADVLEALRIEPAATSTPRPSVEHDGLAGTVAALLDARPQSVDCLAARLSSRAGPVLAALVQLELAGTAARVDGGYRSAP